MVTLSYRLLLLLLLSPACLALVRIFRLLPNHPQELLDRCFREGGRLAVIENKDAQNQALRAVMTQTPNLYLRVRLGAEIFFKDEGFTWVDGGRVAYSNWAPNQPDNFKKRGEKCVEMIVAPGDEQGKWNDQLCDVIPMALCELTSKHKYRVLFNKMSDLAPLCYANGGRLAEINSRSDQKLAVKISRESPLGIIAIRIGARLAAPVYTYRRDRRTFVWPREALAVGYTNWLEGEPNNEKRNEACIEMQLDQYSRWNDVRCNLPFLALCRIATDYNSTLVVVRNTPLAIERQCVRQGGRLMTIEDSDDQSAASKAIKENYQRAKKLQANGGGPDFHKKYQRVLLGARRLKTFTCPEHVFVWVQNEMALNYSNWMSGHPSGVEGRDCVVMKTSGRGEWRSVKCAEPKYALCQYKEVPEPHKRYKVIHEEGINELRHFRFWEQQCRHRGGLIAKISDEEEQLLAEKSVRRLRMDDEKVLLGATQSRYYPRYFSWLDGTRFTYTRWVNETRNEDLDCINIITRGRKLGQWRVADCRAAKALCEFKNNQEIY